MEVEVGVRDLIIMVDIQGTGIGIGARDIRDTGLLLMMRSVLGDETRWSREQEQEQDVAWKPGFWFGREMGEGGSIAEGGIRMCACLGFAWRGWSFLVVLVSISPLVCFSFHFVLLFGGIFIILLFSIIFPILNSASFRNPTPSPPSSSQRSRSSKVGRNYIILDGCGNHSQA